MKKLHNKVPDSYQCSLLPNFPYGHSSHLKQYESGGRRSVIKTGNLRRRSPRILHEECNFLIYENINFFKL